MPELNQQRSTSIKNITILGGIIDLVLAILKVVVGKMGGSAALVADGIHSFSDLISDGIVLYAAKHSSEAPDDDHPYGHDRFETIATLLLGIILLIIGLGIIYDALTRLSSPTALTHTNILLIVAGLSVLSKEALYWLTINVANKYNSSMLRANAWHHRSDAISSIVVMVGIFGSMMGIAYLDLIAALVVGAMIIKISLEFCLSSSKELVDTGIEKADLEKLRGEMMSISGVCSVHSLRTRSFGNSIYADVHVEVMPFLSVSEGHLISVLVEGKAKECLDGLSDITVHIDPEETDHHIAYQELLPREKVITHINQITASNPIDKHILEKRLHYLDGTIHIDFIISYDALTQTQTAIIIEDYLHSILAEDERFGIIRVYYFSPPTN